jgi:WD40 repeat protein
MSKSALHHWVIFLIGWAVLSLACNSLTPNAPEQKIVATSTATLPLATVTASPSPAPTLVPTETPVPSPTPIPWPAEPITQDNVTEIKEINRWGRGTPLEIQPLHGSNEQFLVLTDFGVYLYQTKPPDRLAFIPDADEFYLSQDEQLLAVRLKNGDVQIWNMDDMSLEQTFTHKFPDDIVKKIEEDRLLPFYVGGIAFSPDNSEIAVGYADGAVELYRVGETKSYLTLRHDTFSLWQTDVGLVFQLSYSPDGKTLVVFKFESDINANRLTFWSLPEGELISISDAARFYDFTKPAYLHDNRTLLVFSRRDSYFDLTLWDIQTGAKLKSFGTNLAEVSSTELQENRDELTILGSDAAGTDYRQVWKLPEGRLVENSKLDEIPQDEARARFDKLLFEQGHYYNSWNFEGVSNSAQLAVTGDRAFRVLGESDWLMFPERGSKPLNLSEEDSIWYYDGHEQIFASCTRGALHFREKDGEVTTLEVPSIIDCDGIRISPQRHYAAVWYGKSLYLINLGTAKVNRLSFAEPYAGELPLDARFSLDEEILFTSVHGLVAIWRVDPLLKLVDSHELHYFLSGMNREIVISKDKSLAVSLNASRRKESDPSQIVVWRVEDAFTLHRIRPPFSGTSQPEFTTYALSPDDRLIVSGDDWGGIRIWSIQTGEELAFFDIDAYPLDLAFTPDGSGLIILLGDGTVRLWGVP